MSDHSYFGWINFWLHECKINRTRQIERLQTAICLLSLALAYTAKIKPDSGYARFRKLFCQHDHQRIVHVAASGLWVAQYNGRGRVRLFKGDHPPLPKILLLPFSF